MSNKLEKFGVTLHKEKLNNDADLFLFERKGMPIFLRASFFAGSRFDSISGTAHFLEHMLLAGTKKFPTKNLIASYIQRVGGDFGASTDNNILRFDVEIPEADDLNVGITTMTECLIHSLFNQKTIETERKAIISELRSKRSNPREYIKDIQRKVSLQGTLAARSTLGDESSVSNISKENIIEYGNKYINSGKLCFVASGNISIENLKKGLNKINFEQTDRFKITERLPIIKDVDVEVDFYSNLDQLQVSLICRTNINDYTEYCSLRVLNHILSVGRGSRLITKLRYENGLVYSVSSSVFDTVDWGVLRINFSCSKDNLSKVKDLIFKEFDNLKQNSISAIELANTQSMISKGSIRYFQTSESWVNFHETDALFFPESFHTAEDYIMTINKLTSDDIKKVIGKYLSKDNFYTAIYGNYNR